MSEDLSGILRNLMANPEAVKGLMGSLTGDSPQNKPIPEENPAGGYNPTLGYEDRRISLLNALKPYLNPSRATNVDKAIRLIKLAKMTEAMRNEGK